VGLDARKLGRHCGATVRAHFSGDTAFLDGRCVARQADAFAGGRITDAHALMVSLLDGIAAGVDPPSPRPSGLHGIFIETPVPASRVEPMLNLSSEEA